MAPLSAPPITYATLEHVAQERRPYPTELLEGAETALCMFSAAFLGHNAEIHFAEAGIKTTCVDIDGPRLDEMKQLYPDDWQFVLEDAWQFAERAASVDVKWDIVSVDTFRGNATERSLTTLELWCSIANKAVLATLEIGQTYDTPEGWQADTFQRNREVFWLVLTRE
jgi:extradiol dioxygenase family protein